MPVFSRYGEKFLPYVLLLVGLMAGSGVRAQFYSGSQQEYGKNRVQYQDFLWQQYRFKDMEVYFYKEGRDLARYTAMAAERHLKELEVAFDFAIDERLQFIVYNSLTDFRQSNIGLTSVDGQVNIGGLTRIVGTKIFVYYEGDHMLLDRQIRAGIAHVIIDQMMFGGNWREMLRNATFMSLPAWFTDGVISYHSDPWDAQLNSRLRDGVLSGRFDKFNRLQGDDARLAGHAAVGGGHHGSPAFLTGIDEFDIAVHEGVEDGEIALARYAERLGGPVEGKGFNQNLRGSLGEHGPDS